jgi:N-acetylmuramoyl-L-alanine amidase
VKVERLVVHCSASTWGNRDEITRWHTYPKDNSDGTVNYLGRRYNSRSELPVEVRNQYGNGWSDVGYHSIILNGHPHYGMEYDEKYDGITEYGRAENTIGAHVLYHNRGSLGVCLVGIDKFTDKQMSVLKRWLGDRLWKYDLRIRDIYGHNEFPEHRTRDCPNINMTIFRAKLKLERLLI